MVIFSLRRPPAEIGSMYSTSRSSRFQLRNISSNSNSAIRYRRMTYVYCISLCYRFSGGLSIRLAYLHTPPGLHWLLNLVLFTSACVSGGRLTYGTGVLGWYVRNDFPFQDDVQPLIYLLSSGPLLENVGRCGVSNPLSILSLPPVSSPHIVSALRGAT